MKEFSFGELELSVLKAVRVLEKATVHQVIDQLGEKRSYTTVMTVMSRLAQKGELQREKIGNKYEYWIASDREHIAPGLLQRIQDKVFGGKKAALVSYLLDTDQKISDDELDELEKMIQQKRLEKKNG